MVLPGVSASGNRMFSIRFLGVIPSAGFHCRQHSVRCGAAWLFLLSADCLPHRTALSGFEFLKNITCLVLAVSSRAEQVDGADGKAAAQVLVDIATAPLSKAAAAAGGGKKGKRRTPLTRPLVR